MPWGKVDDTFYDHDKVLELPSALRNEACGLYWRAISYCNAKLTDGVVSDSIVEHLNGRPEVVEALLVIRLWHRRTRGGYQIHDFADFNKLRAEIEAEREKKAAAGRLGGFRSGQARAKQHGSTVVSTDEAHGQHAGVQRATNSESESDRTTPPYPPRKRGGRRGTNGQGYDDLLRSDDDPTPEPDSDTFFAGVGRP